MTGSVDPHDWVAALAERLGVPAPGDATVEDLLSAAGTAAHTAERWVAPVSTWLAGRADLSSADARRLVEELATDMAGRPDAPDDPDDPDDPDGIAR